MAKKGVLRETILFLGMIFLIASYVLAADSSVPYGPNSLNVTESGRYANFSDPIPLEAEAGNVTALTIHSTTVTKSWQGYYGNVTGRITLDDADNMTLYDWQNPDPKGEIYASNGSAVDWSNVYCMNVSSVRPANTGLTTESGGIVYNTNGSQIELDFGINLTDWDGLNETFNDTYTDPTGFKVGAITIDTLDGCSMAHPYTNETYMENEWQEVLLSDNESLIFTSILRENADSFKEGINHRADFQMLVLENGHVGHESITTTYYFYVELS